MADQLRLSCIGVSQRNQRLVAVAEKRIGIGDGLQAGDGRGPVFAAA